jgi:hypothetical protein
VISPYSAAAGVPVVAVAPLANESGTSAVDTLAVSDALVARMAEVQGLAPVPLNRTIAVMRSMRMNGVKSGAEARRLLAALGVDALVVGSVTAYDPYNPPKMGIQIGVFVRDGGKLSEPAAKDIDPFTLQTATSDPTMNRPKTGSEEPESVVGVYLDGVNHQVLTELQAYAVGRHDRTGPLGWRKYLVSMDLYTEFAAFTAVSRLLDKERARVSGVAAVEVPVSPPAP